MPKRRRGRPGSGPGTLGLLRHAATELRRRVTRNPRRSRGNRAVRRFIVGKTKRRR